VAGKVIINLASHWSFTDLRWFISPHTCTTNLYFYSVTVIGMLSTVLNLTEN